jgi:cytochrome c553
MARSSFGLGISWSIIAATALLACGGGQPAPATATEPGTAPAAEAEGSADLVWSDSMPVKDKGIFMKKKVMPAMSKTFKEYDAKQYAAFSCKTCHGPQMKPKPVDFLPELNIKDGKMKEAEEHPEIAKFMHEKVVPEMAGLFGKPPYDPATNSGFGCGGCHKINM